MKNFKKESSHAIGEGQSNRNTINVLNPNNEPMVLRGHEWINPTLPDYNDKHKAHVKSVIQINKEAVIKKKE
jgi:hypothetical protein